MTRNDWLRLTRMLSVSLIVVSATALMVSHSITRAVESMATSVAFDKLVHYAHMVHDQVATGAPHEQALQTLPHSAVDGLICAWVATSDGVTSWPADCKQGETGTSLVSSVTGADQALSSGNANLAQAPAASGSQDHANHVGHVHDHSGHDTGTHYSDQSMVPLSWHWSDPAGRTVFYHQSTAFSQGIGAVEVHLIQDKTALTSSHMAALQPVTLVITLAMALVCLIACGIELGSRVRDRVRLKKLQIAKLTDPLTGLPNRKGTREGLEAIFQERKANGEQITMVVLDIDRFSEVNSQIGPDHADEVLCYIARGIRKRINTEDFLGRIGPDQFIVGLRGCGEEGSLEVVEIISEFLSRSIPIGGQTLSLGISIGIAFADTQRHGMKTYHEAMIALREAKRRGGNTQLVFGPDLEATDRREREILKLLRLPPSENSVWFALQPIIDLKNDNAVTGYEALMRLRSKSGDVYSPAEFIPIAENHGLIQELGLRAIRIAAEYACDLPGDLFVAVNLSAVQFRSGQLPLEIEAILAATGCPPSKLELEVTESLLLEEDINVPIQLAELRGLGLRISIDDFGTGHSSLGYLWKYQFDKLKIDRAFLEGYDFDRRKHREIIETIVVLGAKLGLTTVIEGVETEEHAALARELGSDQAQGYFFGRPAPYKTIVADLPEYTSPPLRIVR